MLDRWYDELAIGDEATFGGVTVTEAHVVNFASFSGDWNALHMDEEFARAGPFGQRIAHGFLTVGLMNGRVTMAPCRARTVAPACAFRPTCCGRGAHRRRRTHSSPKRGIG